MMMPRRIEDGRLMTGGADLVTRGNQRQGVRVVTVHTTHASGVHTTLLKGPGNEDLVPDLTVGKVERFLWRHQRIAVVKGRPRTRTEVCATGMAAHTIHLGRRSRSPQTSDGL